MPEGPEVLCITDQLDFYLNGRILSSLEWIKGDEESVFELPVKIIRVSCKGKLIIFECRNQKNQKNWIVNSLRMTGNWSLTENKYTRVIFNLVSNIDLGIFDITQLYFNDVRQFGTFEFIDDRDEYKEIIDSISYGFIGDYIITYDDFHNSIKKQKKSFLVSKLMDQKSICSGIGNYLLSEILYSCRFHPEIRCSDLDDNLIKRLYDICMNIITTSYRNGGLMIQDYTGLNGQNGCYEKYIQVYGRSQDSQGNRVYKIKGKHGRSIWFVQALQTLKG